MCGLAGFSFNAKNMPTTERLHDLAMGLAWGIDNRGGDSVGFFGREGSQYHIGHGMGTWWENGPIWPSCHELAMHARFATCGTVRLDNAHPYRITRSWGDIDFMHNGMAPDAYASALEHGRDYTVDSRELGELMADGQYESLASIPGYGVFVWRYVDEPDTYLCRVTSDSDLVVYELVGGGVVWGSTERIVRDACELAGLDIAFEYRIRIGDVYAVSDGVIVLSDHERVTLAPRWSRYGGNAEPMWSEWSVLSDDPEEWESYETEPELAYYVNSDASNVDVSHYVSYQLRRA